MNRFYFCVTAKDGAVYYGMVKGDSGSDARALLENNLEYRGIIVESLSLTIELMISGVFQMDQHQQGKHETA